MPWEGITANRQINRYMKTEQTPITGRENPRDLPPQLQALSEFYAAFNERDLEKMIGKETESGMIPNYLEALTSL